MSSPLPPGTYAVQTAFSPDRNLRNEAGRANVVPNTRDTWEFRITSGGSLIIIHQPVVGNSERVLSVENESLVHGARVRIEPRNNNNQSQRWRVISQSIIGNRRAYNIVPSGNGNLVISANGTQRVLNCDLGNRISNEPRQLWFFDPA